MIKRVPNIDDAKAYVAATKYGTVHHDRGGLVPLPSLFSTVEFQKQVVSRTRPDTINYIYTNFEEYTPLELVMNTDLATTVLESFPTSVKMFDRGMVLAVSRVKRPSSIGRNNLLADLITNMDSFSRNLLFCKMTDDLYIYSQWNQILLYKVRNRELLPLMLPVVKTANLPFIMALRRHNIALPKSLMELHVSEHLSGKHSEFEMLRKWYRKTVYWRILDSKLRIIDKSQAEMSRYVFKPQVKFSSIREMKQEAEEAWKQTLENMS